MAAQAENLGQLPAEAGLRSRKKAKRREQILVQARALFERKGIQATTMAEIADAVGVSPPTIFNYFGNKDGILIALITEGSNRSRDSRMAATLREDCDFISIVCDMLAEVSRVTLGIADKRVWRYAEAATIRHPTTELAQRYIENDRALLGAIQTFLDRYDLQMRAPGPPDTALLAQVVFDAWTSLFYALIRDEAQSLDTHCALIRDKFTPLCTYLFSDAFLRAPQLKP